MIGIGVTTYKRSEVFRLFWDQLFKYLPDNCHVHIAKDIDNISQAKNSCLEALKDCEYIFLFDDDCFPIAKDWHVPFIKSGYKHLLYMKSYHNLQGKQGMILSYKDCSGVFAFFWNEIPQKIGYYGNYGRYGFEHAGYSHRIHKAGLTDVLYPCLEGTEKYIHSLDLDGSFNGIVAKPTIPVNEIKTYIENNKKIYEQEVAN